MEKAHLKKQRYFIERDLFFQTLTLLLTVLLGGFLLLLLSKTISGYVDSSILFLMLFAGYFLLIIFFSWSLSRKFIGPFSRLKANMKDISQGDFTLRLMVRKGDDVRITHFVEEANRMVISFNNAIEKIKDPCTELDALAVQMIRKLKTDNDIPKAECLELLQSLQERTAVIKESVGRFKTGKRSL
ncbi:MAG: methyl-accepting chemotaxis protein [Deltaproteobacteria bacterium]|nr:methyl-accepting chemotaxis protein [Deltaproteobacteria bacterium]